MQCLFHLNKLKVLLTLHQFHHVSYHAKLKICNEILGCFFFFFFTCLLFPLLLLHYKKNKLIIIHSFILSSCSISTKRAKMTVWRTNWFRIYRIFKHWTNSYWYDCFVLHHTSLILGIPAQKQQSVLRMFDDLSFF